MRLSSLALAALTLALTATAGSPGTAAARGPTAPVVVELFTSEGCSSCPAADVVLERLAREQPVAGAEVIALELHVDYWNHLGWVDRFSQPGFTARQGEYNRAFARRGSYTPQLVVDGQRELVGSRGRDAEDAIGDAARAQKTRVTVTRSGDKVTVAIDGLPESRDTEPVDVMLAVTEGGLATRALAGENAGATLAHGPVVRELRRISSVSAAARGPVLVKDVEVNVDPSWRRDQVRAVAFLQRQKSLHILGAGVVALK
jgi:hypothetical protein